MAKHGTQTRKGSEIPYLGHLLSVAGLVIDAGGSEKQAIAALLHDAAEDQGGEDTLAEIRDKFGDAVAEIVEQCSDTFEMPKPPWRERKQKYVDHLPEASDDALLVSLADKLHNLAEDCADVIKVCSSSWKMQSTRWKKRSVNPLSGCEPKIAVVIELWTQPELLSNGVEEYPGLEPPTARR